LRLIRCPQGHIMHVDVEGLGHDGEGPRALGIEAKLPKHSR